MKTFKKYFKFNAEPKDIFNAITNKDMLEIWTGEKAEMTPEPETEFSLWDGSIIGKNLEVEQNKKLVQEWYFGEEVPSIVTIKIHPDKKGTSVELIHTNIPDEAFKNIKEGWVEDYFGSLALLFNDED